MNTEDLFNTLKSVLVERISSPFWWSFTISWCLWNYSFLMVLFSDNSVSTTVLLIQQFAYPTGWHKAFFGVIGPLSSALAYVFIYPYAAKRMSDFTLERERELNESRQKIHDESLLSVEESNRLRVNIRKLKNEFDKQLKELDDENKALAEENLRLKSDAMAREGPILEDFEDDRLQRLSDRDLDSLINREINEEEKSLLQIIGTNAGSIRFQNLKGLTQLTEVKLQWLIDELLSKKLVVQLATGEKGGTVKLTKSGRDFFVRHNL